MGKCVQVTATSNHALGRAVVAVANQKDVTPTGAEKELLRRGLSFHFPRVVIFYFLMQFVVTLTGIPSTRTKTV